MSKRTDKSNMNTEEPESEFDAKWEVDKWQTSGSVSISAEDIEDCRDVESAMEQIDEDLRRDFEQTVRWFRPNNDALETWIQSCIDARKARDDSNPDQE